MVRWRREPGAVAGVVSSEVVAMQNRAGFDVGFRGAWHGVAAVVLAAGGYLLVLLLLAFLAAGVVRVL